MRLKASLPSYKQIEVNIPPTKTVEDLKRLICDKLGIESTLTELLLQGKRLTKNTRLSKVKGLNETVIVDYLWARHLILWGTEGQNRIRSSNILLAGAGAIGNEVAKNLAMLGVGRLLIVDRDTVELSNVSRMIFFQPQDIGKNKAETLAKNLQKDYPYVETVAYRGPLETLPLKYYLDSNFIICGLDNVVSRMYLTQISRKYGIPLIDGGIIGLNARIHVYIPPEDPCPICMFPSSQYSQIVGLRNPCDAPVEQQTIPSFSTSISLVSAILAQEAIKLILGQNQYVNEKKWPETTGPPLRSILFIDMKNNRFSSMELKRSKTCIVCGKDGTTSNPALQIQLPLSTLRQPNFEKTIRTAAKLQNGTLRVFTETADGELMVKNAIPRLKKGDYLRVLCEKDDGEHLEMVCKLT